MELKYIEWSSWFEQTQGSHLLPELHHRTGEVARVWDAVVVETAFRIPGITTTLPRQILRKKETKKDRKKERKKGLPASKEPRGYVCV